MTAFWTEPDFDEHEMVQFVHDRKSGLDAIVALHSTHLGPGAGGTRFWHYAQPDGALRDALRLPVKRDRRGREPVAQAAARAKRNVRLRASDATLLRGLHRAPRGLSRRR